MGYVIWCVGGMLIYSFVAMPWLIGWIRETYPGASGILVLLALIALVSAAGWIVQRTEQRRARGDRSAPR